MINLFASEKDLLNKAESLFTGDRVKEAYAYFQKLVKKGNGRALYFVGKYNAEGWAGVPKNVKLGFQYYHEGAEKGDLLCRMMLAYEKGADKGGILAGMVPQLLVLVQTGDIVATAELADVLMKDSAALAGHGFKNVEQCAESCLITAAESGYWLTLIRIENGYADETNGSGKIEGLGNENLEKIGRGLRKLYELKGNHAGWAARILGSIFIDAEDNESAAEWYRRGAELGDDGSMFKFGVCYKEGVGIEKNLSKAKNWFQKAYDIRGEAAGQAACKIGLLFFRNNDYESAVEWYRSGAELGDDESMVNFGFCYAEGVGVEENLSKAKIWFKNAYGIRGEWAGQAAGRLGNLCDNEGDKESATEWYRRGAELGDERAMFNLGVCYATGKGVEEDKNEAKVWYQKVYEGRGEVAGYAARCIGNLYAQINNYESAVEWLRRGAELGDDGSMFNLGDCYGEGKGVEKDWHKAVEWYQKAYEIKGECAGVAALNIGSLFDNNGDYESAVEWYRRGAELGDDGAMFNLGVCYEEGKGVEENQSKAREWYRKAYEGKGECAGQAACNIGNLFYNNEYYESAVEWYRRGAELGDDESMLSLGECYEEGEGVEEDKNEAKTWYQKVYEGRGEVAGYAARCIGNLYLQINNYESAVEWCRRGAELGDDYAMLNTGLFYEYGKGVEKDWHKAVEWYQKAYEIKGECAGKAACNIGILFGDDGDYESAVEWYQRGAELGDDISMLALGIGYEEGIGVEKDWRKALEWYRKVYEKNGEWKERAEVQIEKINAENGDDFAMLSLGGRYERGDGVEEDLDQAYKWYRKAYEIKGECAGKAACNIGILFENDGDYESAAEWYRRGAELGDDESMLNTGICYGTGQGVEEDPSKAVEWYRKAYEIKGECAGKAACNIGILFGNDGDYESAVEWYRRGAELGNDQAMINLGTCYEDGNGVKEDRSKALEWYRKVYEIKGKWAGRAANNIGSLFDDDEAYVNAAEWYRRGAELGDDGSMLNTGFCYGAGQGVEKDRSKALEWYRKAYEIKGKCAGKAACNIGILFGNDGDYESAAEWYRRGAELGDDHAMLNTGFCYGAGQGVEKDPSKAFEWFRKAYEIKGECAGKAACNIRVLFENDGDYERALGWVQRGVELDDDRSMLALGVYYEEGIGVEKDWRKALEWYRKAYEMQGEEAEDAANRIRRLGERVGVAVAAGETFVDSPMSGKIIAISKKVGDVVSEDDEVMVLEAMKMGYPIMAPCSGNIKSISVQVGMSVQDGDQLFVIG